MRQNRNLKKGRRMPYARMTLFVVTHSIARIVFHYFCLSNISRIILEKNRLIENNITIEGHAIRALCNMLNGKTIVVNSQNYDKAHVTPRNNITNVFQRESFQHGWAAKIYHSFSTLCTCMKEEYKKSICQCFKIVVYYKDNAIPVALMLQEPNGDLEHNQMHTQSKHYLPCVLEMSPVIS